MRHHRPFYTYFLKRKLHIWSHNTFLLSSQKPISSFQGVMQSDPLRYLGNGATFWCAHKFYNVQTLKSSVISGQPFCNPFSSPMKIVILLKRTLISLLWTNFLYSRDVQPWWSLVPNLRLCNLTEWAGLGRAPRENSFIISLSCHLSTYFQQAVFPGLGVNSQTFYDYSQVKKEMVP